MISLFVCVIQMYILKVTHTVPAQKKTKYNLHPISEYNLPTTLETVTMSPYSILVGFDAKDTRSKNDTIVMSR